MHLLTDSIHWPVIIISNYMLTSV